MLSFEMKTKSTRKQSNPTWAFRLYVAGQTPRSIAAFENLKRICDRYVPGDYRIDVVDLERDPSLAGVDQILAIPTVVRERPLPVRKVIGDLSNTDRVLATLNFPRPDLDRVPDF